MCRSKGVAKIDAGFYAEVRCETYLNEYGKSPIHKNKYLAYT
jgi:hypothetical protein